MAWYSIKLIGDTLSLIDQRVIPNTIEYFSCKNYKDVIYGIKEMVVRGAPQLLVLLMYQCKILTVRVFAQY